MSVKSCNRNHFAKRLNDVRKEKNKIDPPLRPLFKHIIKLAQQSIRVGACKRAGRELTMAKRMVTKYPVK